MESIVRSISGAKLIRINPAHPQCPKDITAVGLPLGTDSILTIKNLLETVPEEDLHKAVKQFTPKYIGHGDQHPLVNWLDVFISLRTKLDK